MPNSLATWLSRMHDWVADGDNSNLALGRREWRLPNLREIQASMRPDTASYAPLEDPHLPSLITFPLTWQKGCRTCTERGIKCPGFAVKLSWPADILESKPRHRNRRQRGRPPNASSQESSSSTEVIKSRRDEGVNLSAVSTSGLPSQESFYLSHFFRT